MSGGEWTLNLEAGGCVWVGETGDEPDPGDLYVRGVTLSVTARVGARVVRLVLTPEERVQLMQALGAPIKEDT